MNETNSIKKLQKDIVIPDIVQAKADKAFAQIKAESMAKSNTAAAPKSASHRFSWKKVCVVAAAAVLATGTITAGAAAYMNWSRSLGDGMRANEEQKQQLEDSHTAFSIEQSVTSNGVTVTAQQSIVDSYYALISFKVEGYDCPDGAQPDFETIRYTVNGTDSLSGGGSFYNGLIANEYGRPSFADGSSCLNENGNLIEKYKDENGNLEYKLTLANSHTEGFFINAPVHIEFQNLGTVAKAAYTPDIEGSWTFDFTLQGSSEALKYQPEAPLGDTGISIASAEVSPISLSVIYDYPRPADGEVDVDEDGYEKEPPRLMGVRLKDGTLLPYLYEGPGSQGYTAEDSSLYRTAFAIDRILDVDQVDALLFEKTYPGDNIQPTEENFYVIPLT